MLIISSVLRRSIEAAAEAGYPREVCGFLLGRVGDAWRSVERVRPVPNAWAASPEMRAALFESSEGRASREEWEAATEDRRFLIDPRDFAEVDREASGAGLAIIGFYHSHPDHPAIPSRFDRDMAMPEQSYVIVSVRGGHPADFRSWVVPDYEADFQEEEVLDEAQAV